MTSSFSPGPSGPGGFIQPSVSSPAPSTMTNSTVTPSILPKPRAHPLRPGSMKETAVINHIDKSILAINRRHAKKFSGSFDDQAQKASEKGYESFKEVVKDVEAIVDVLWVTGTPSLQIPYLISLAVMINSYLPDYPFSPRSTFRLLRKLDSVFSSLLLGEDSESGAPLPGFENRRHVVSMTEKVRIKSIAESCRLAVLEAREQEDAPVEEDDDEDDKDVNGMTDDDDDMADVFGTNDYDDSLGKWEIEAAKVYEKTIQLLGDELGKQGDICDITGPAEEGCQPSNDILMA